jgi:hypothetical protein
MPEAERLAMKSWAEVERHGARWHAEQVEAARLAKEFADAAARMPFGIPAHIPRRHEVDGLVFRLLLTPLELSEEGLCMRHCVGNYARRVGGGSYLVYSVEGLHRLTLGLRLTRRGWVVDQARGKFNAAAAKAAMVACREFAALVNGVKSTKAA